MIRTTVLAAYLIYGQSFAQGLLALPEGKAPNDSRLKPPVTLHDYHPFRGVGSKAEWEVRQKEIVRRIAVGCGLWPQPKKTPLNAVVHRKINQGDYTVESVFFESMPGHFVTGNLYRPAGESSKLGVKNGKRPAVLCAHGHWQNARFAQQSDTEAKKQIAIGAERFLNAGKSIHQARCVQLARMGCVVFFYDMLGNGDSKQFPEHRRGPRAEASGEAMGEWGFVSKNATARLQTNFGLQTWNSIRSLDFVLGLEEVDSERVLVTGASGGATQTMMVSALDERVKAAFPCVMVSTAMQGGCTCENTHYLRIGQGNVDIAAAVAPRPLGLTAADDWTIELEEKGHPDLLKLFKMVDSAKHYEAHFDVHFKHNYNHVSRTHLYQFVNRHFGLGMESPLLERDFKLLGKKELSVFDEKHPAPSGENVGLPHEKALNRWWAEDSNQQVEVLLNPKSKEEFSKTKKVIGGAVNVMIGRKLPEKGEVNFELVSKEAREGFMELSGLVQNSKHGEEIPASFLYPLGSWGGHVVIWLSPLGKGGIFSEGSEPIDEVKKLLNRGVAVMGLDLFGQGEFLKSETLKTSGGRNPGLIYSQNQNADLPSDSWQRSPVYYYGYNDSTFARRVHDVLTAVSFARYSDQYEVKKISLVAPKGAGHWAAAARAVAGGEVIQKAWIDTSGFRFGSLESHWEADFLPGAVKYGDVEGFLVLNAPFDTALFDDESELVMSLKPKSKMLGGRAASMTSPSGYLFED
ncbi:acetylxylan esterase [Akkermansiaceae bacterium]|nr:acetylxylan esterase [Akkermansiaceae bacterium]MDB4536984.1 acetylxylan esterase [Akkermansiaceae bacterium]